MYIREIIWLITWPVTILAALYIVKAVLKKKNLLKD